MVILLLLAILCVLVGSLWPVAAAVLLWLIGVALDEL